MKRYGARKQVTARNKKRLARKSKKPLIDKLEELERLIEEDIKDSEHKGFKDLYLINYEGVIRTGESDEVDKC